MNNESGRVGPVVMSDFDRIFLTCTHHVHSGSSGSNPNWAREFLEISKHDLTDDEYWKIRRACGWMEQMKFSFANSIVQGEYS